VVCPCATGVSAFDVLTIFNTLPSCTSQTHPLPNCETAAVVNLVEDRLSKASSLDPKKVEKRLDAVDATTGIWLGSSSVVPEDDEEK
jgi:hypothetical protein